MKVRWDWAVLCPNKTAKTLTLDNDVVGDARLLFVAYVVVAGWVEELHFAETNQKKNKR